MKVKRSNLIIIAIGIILGVIVGVCCIFKEDDNVRYERVEEQDDLYVVNITRQELGLKTITQEEIDSNDEYKIFYVNGGLCIMTNEEVKSLGESVIEEKWISETIGW